MTPHIESKLEDISNIVIMAGDANRVKYIANNYLSNVKEVNSVRGCLAYTGYYKDKRVTLFTSGMGNPSMGIYSYELFKFYDVDYIIRIGSAGSYSKDLNVRDIYLVNSSYSDSSYLREYNGSTIKEVDSSKDINNIILDTSNRLGISIKKGKVHCSDAFYTVNKLDIDTNIYKCVEMETFSLFSNAINLGKKASCILTISNSFVTNDSLSSIEREQGFNDMIKLSLESILSL